MAAERRQINAATRMRELAVLEMRRGAALDDLAEIESILSSCATSGAHAATIAAKGEHLHRVLADLDGTIVDARRAAGLGPERAVDPEIARHLDEIGLGEVRP